ncbi:helix-turn-helix domain-containing protein [Saccharothrix syringae]|uniref:XRE family transcriptional regulator n=1 Tax=Saccharothrix syringae TaxID=103733 RepID=A0A5Q0H2W4_SACSY|nr:helix-turn-helix transcriptional regulator [Saccharothrix syringae]QFZ20433.1 XRE family transcriptional regulator [Saccharothrix syringae]
MNTEREDTTSPRISTARTRELGEELRRARQKAEFSTAGMAQAMGRSLGWVSKLQNGYRNTSSEEISVALGVFRTDRPTRERIQTLAAEVGHQGPFARLHIPASDTMACLAITEELAARMVVYDARFVPDLLQTSDYTLALTGDQDVVDDRSERIRNFARKGRANVTFFLPESALIRTVGSRRTMVKQMSHMVTQSQVWDAVLRVVPASTPIIPELRHSGTLVAFPDPLPPLVHVRGEMATVFMESPEAIERYKEKIKVLDRIALSAGESVELILRYGHGNPPEQATVTPSRAGAPPAVSAAATTA